MRGRAFVPRACSDLEAHLPEEWWRKPSMPSHVRPTAMSSRTSEEHAPRGGFHRVCGGGPAAQPHPRPVLRARAALPGACSSRLQACDGSRPLSLPRRGSPRSAPRTRGCRCSSRRATRATHGCRKHTDWIAIMGNSFGYFSNKQDDEKVLNAVGKICAQWPVGARHHRRRAHARELRQALVGVDRRASFCVPGAHDQPGSGKRRIPRREDRARRDGGDR